MWSSTLLMLLGQDHLTLLNGMYYCSIVPASSCSWAWVYSIQCIHTLRPFVIVVQGTCTIIPCYVARRLDPITTQEVHATIRPALGELRRRCEALAQMPGHWLLAQRRSLVCRWNLPSCERRYCEIAMPSLLLRPRSSRFNSGPTCAPTFRALHEEASFRLGHFP